jgi:3-dehydroquinate synthase
MNFLQQSFTVKYEYKVFFTENLFNPNNSLFKDFLDQFYNDAVLRKILFVIDENIAKSFPNIQEDIDLYFDNNNRIDLIKEKVIVGGGEIVKNDEQYFDRIVEAINHHGIDRHSYVVAIGGGSVLDLCGYAAAVSHRGIKHIRIPTTVLSQDDSGVGVKNSVNYKGKKNFLGTFAPPFAVFNDYSFLKTLGQRDWLSGISEAVKVSLIKDEDFFVWIEKHAELLVSRDAETMQHLIKECAEFHLKHIASGDPFEFGSSRPLDFGHWSAHKVEQLSGFKILHGEAVAMGIALDSVYSYFKGFLTKEKAERILSLLTDLNLPISHDLMQINELNHPILLGLREFQEHLGGQLTIMLLQDIGVGLEVHEMDFELIIKASEFINHFIKNQ